MSDNSLKDIPTPDSNNEIIQNKRIRQIRVLFLIMVVILVISGVLTFYKLFIPAIIGACLIIVGGASAFNLILKSFGDYRQSVRDITGTSNNQGEVISDFSHRIREPLNNLVIIGELLSETDLSEQQEDLVETMIASTTNMVTTVNELTMQSAATITRGERKLISFSFMAAIQNTLELFNMNKDPKIDYTIISVDEGGPFLKGDPIILKQIILDILNNYAKLSSDKNPSLHIEIKKPVETARELLVTLNMTTTEHLFDHNSDTGSQSLAIKLIKLNNGNYNYSTEGEKATLTITLPFNRIEPVKVPQQVSSKKIATLRKEEPKKKEMKELNVLLVEDNIINQKITYLTLQPLVRSIDTASNGKEALDRMATADYDLVLMDIQMPVMDGLIASEKIRALEKSTDKHVPIIAITANAMLGDKEKCLSAGMDDYISKPFQPAALIEIIRKFF